MPKPMKLMIEVEEMMHGRIFRMLDGMPGVVTITPIGDGPKVPKSLNGKGKKGKGGTVYCLVLGALIAADKALNRDTLRDMLAANGKSATSLPDALTKMKKAKHILIKNAMYTITPGGRKHYDTACPIEE